MRASVGGALCIGFIISGASCGNSELDLFDPDLGLLAHWALDESQRGSPVADSSGFGNDGTPTSPAPVPTTNVPPVHFPDPYSLSFDGSSQWIALGNPPLLNLGGATTMAAWIRPTATDGTRDVLGHGYTQIPDHDFSLRIKSGTYQFTTWDGADHVAIAAIPASDVGTWVHLCGVFDGAAYYVYRNGELAGSTTDATAPPANDDLIWAIGARAPQNVGQSAANVDYLFQGQIDDVRLYGRALSAAEVRSLYRR